MIELGCFDAGTSDAACTACLKQVETLTRVPLTQVVPSRDRLVLASFTPDAHQTMTVAQVQQGLQDIGFFPGGKVDGICGYRTMSAIRLFQEYVRAIEKTAGMVPDGRFGPVTQQHLQRWIDGKLQPDWTPIIEAWKTGTPGPGEYADWLALLDKVKARSVASPTSTQQKVDAFAGANDTRKTPRWDFAAAGNIHLVGIRRHQVSGKFDDIVVLLIKGLVFKFQGSTEPGASADPRGWPYLVPGQHDYHFGWHQKKYLALRPQSAGVLVVRSKGGKSPGDAELANGLEPNPSINIHWGGKGMLGNVNNWSEGCQVINGSVYINEKDELVSCAAFAALNNDEVAANAAKTRGAYNVLVDLVTALASDLSPTVKYTLLTEEDLALAPAVGQKLAAAREGVEVVLLSKQ